MNTTLAAAKQFEETVKSLLSAAQHQVFAEQLAGHKKVDLIVEETTIMGRRRVAVECKHYSSALTKRDVLEICVDYSPLLTRGLVDGLLIVSRCGLAPSAVTYLENTPDVRHATFAELQSGIMGFDAYLGLLIRQYQEDGLSQYYVPVLTPDGQDLEHMVSQWIVEDTPEQLAVQASYGLGKTSFARHIAAAAAQAFRDDPTRRIPIMIRLGDISAQQTAESIVNRALGGVVRGYHYDAFMLLNEAGRLLLLLDGFDEMQHMLSIETIMHNLNELNRLVRPNSKVLLLGRPTLFWTGYEEDAAFSATRAVAGQTYRDPDWPVYRRVNLAPFTPEQIERFLALFSAYREGKRGAKRIRRLQELLTGGDEQTVTRLTDIATRPVQLKMLAEVLPQFSGDISQLTLAMLYSEFIDLIIRREMVKQTRRTLGTDARRRFARELAVWTWQRGVGGFAAHEIPSAIMQAFATSSLSVDAAKRDLINACFLERKGSDILYFPHRSFQEFLVAEALVERLDCGALSLADLDTLLTGEVPTFLAGLANIGNFTIWEKQLQRHRGTLPLRFLEVWISDERYGAHIRERIGATRNPWWLVLYMLWCRAFASEAAGPVLNKLKTFRPAGHEDALYVLLAFLCCGCIDQTTTIDALAALSGWGSAASPNQGSTHGFVRDALSQVRHRPSTKQIEFTQLYEHLHYHLRDYCLVAEWAALDPAAMAGRLRLPTRMSASGCSRSLLEYFSK